jgi:uncharacterized membrane protein (DUF4010 family)
MLLAWKTELSRFAGGLKPSEIRSAVLLALIGFVIYPVLPNRYIDRWNLFNPSDAWISVIAIAGIGFTNYVLLRLYSTGGLYLGAILGGVVNSTVTAAELSSRAREAGMVSRTTGLCPLTTMAMFFRNLVLATLFAPRSLSATLVPLLAMTLVAGLLVWPNRTTNQPVGGTIALTRYGCSPSTAVIELRKFAAPVLHPACLCLKRRRRAVSDQAQKSTI